MLLSGSVTEREETETKWGQMKEEKHKDLLKAAEDAEQNGMGGGTYRHTPVFR